MHRVCESALAFCRISQHGDDEGLPTAHEADLIRGGKRHLSPEALASLERARKLYCKPSHGQALIISEWPVGVVTA
jgi:hypothetical protein